MDFKKLGNGVVYLSKKAKKLVSFKIIFILFLIAICWQSWIVKKELKTVEEKAAQALIYAMAAGTRSYSSPSIDDLESEVSSLKTDVSNLEYDDIDLKSDVSSLKRKVSSLESESHSEYHSH